MYYIWVLGPVGYLSDQWPDRRFDTLVWHCSFVEIDHEIVSRVILFFLWCADVSMIQSSFPLILISLFYHILQVQEVFDPEDLQATWDATFLPKKYYVWVPNKKKKRRKKTGTILQVDGYEKTEMLSEIDITNENRESIKMANSWANDFRYVSFSQYISHNRIHFHFSK